MAKHLSLDERIVIQQMLEQHASFKAIARTLGRNCSTISKEIRSHLVFQKKGCMGHAFNDCANRFDCPHTHLCSKPGCTYKYCRFCSRCHLFCDDYFKVECRRLPQPPYVCNGCENRRKCTLEKRIYSASAAHSEYLAVHSESRSGLCLSEEEAWALDDFFSPLLFKGQSIHHICAAHPDEIMYSERSIYNDTNAGIFRAKNIDEWQEKHLCMLCRILDMDFSDWDWNMDKDMAGQSGKRVLSDPVEKLDTIMREHYKASASKEKSYGQVMQYILGDSGLSAAQIEQLRLAAQAGVPEDEVMKMAKGKKEPMEVRRCVEFFQMVQQGKGKPAVMAKKFGNKK